MTKRVSVILWVVFSAGLLGAPSAGAATAFECSGQFSGEVAGNLVVRPDTFCIILNSVIHGNVVVEPGAIGFHSHASTIDGTVRSTLPQLDIRVLDSTVKGSVIVRRTHSGTVGAICRSFIGGNVELIEDAGDMYLGQTGFGGVCFGPDVIDGNLVISDGSGYVPVVGETVGGNVRVVFNLGVERLIGNTIHGNLTCRKNSPPVDASGNTVDGRATGECAAP